jgi:hypothetical protein
MVALASRTAFGHDGSYVFIGWAAPEREVAIGYVTSVLVPRAAGAAHMAAVRDTMLAACS